MSTGSLNFCSSRAGIRLGSREASTGDSPAAINADRLGFTPPSMAYWRRNIPDSCPPMAQNTAFLMLCPAGRGISIRCI